MLSTTIRTNAQKIKSRLFNDKNPIPQHSGQSFEVNMWMISRFIEKKILPIVGHSPFPITEQSLLVATVCKTKPSHIFDWGTNIGVSARIFYETCKYFSINAEIHSIDLPDDTEHKEHPKKRRGKLVRHLNSVHLHLGDGAETSLKILKSSKIKPKNPLFFLDGDHSFESVLRELELISNNFENANFLIHDTFYQTKESNYNIGPHLAVEEFIGTSGKNYEKIAENLGLPGMTFLYKKE
jgi:cephalosporin hydroxylase